MRDALAFFYLQRSGIAIDDGSGAGLRAPVGHPGDASVEAWTGPDADGCTPAGRVRARFDVSGGWYDAGDHGKYVTSGAMPVWQLLATIELMRRRGARQPGGRRRKRSWSTNAAGSSTGCCGCRCRAASALAGMAFHRVHGTEWSPMPGWPHEDPTTRVLHRPSTAATLQLAAAAAHGARVLRATTPRTPTGCSTPP